MRNKLCRVTDAAPWVQKLQQFFLSPWYPALVALVAFIGFAGEVDLFAMALSAILACIAMVLSPNLLPALPPTCMIAFHMCRAHSPIFTVTMYWARPQIKPSTYFTEGAPRNILIVLGCLVVVCFLFHMWLRRPFQSFYKEPPKLFFWALPLAAGLILNGFFFSGYTLKNMAFGLVTAVVWVGVYLIYRMGFPKGKETSSYCMYTLVCTILLLLAELVWVYATSFDAIFAEEGVDKGDVFFGWGIANNYGGIMTMLMPICFYLSTEEKGGVLFWLMGFASYVAVVLSFSRSALLVASLLLVPSVAVTCFRGKRKKLYGITALSLVGVGGAILAGVLILSPDKLSVISYYLDRGLNDTGRFKLWAGGLQQLWEHWFFGVGFYAVDFDSWARTVGMPGFLHNTLVELLAATGLFGTVFYLVYRGCTAWLFLKKPTVKRVFLGLGVLGLLGTSLLDNHLFNIYPGFFYALYLVLAEQDLDETVKSQGNLHRLH